MPRPKKAPKVSVSKTFDTKTALRTAFNALKATGNLPGPAGRELLETVSQKAFDAWKSHQTTLINERRLDLSVQENRTFLIEEMHKFFDNKEVAQAEGFVEPEKTLDDAVKSYNPPPPPII